MSFKFKLENSKIFKNAFEAICLIVDELQLQIDSEGLRCSSLDRSHITFCNLELNKELFDEYECNGVEKINVDTLELMNVMKRLKPTDVLECSSDEGNIIFKFHGDATRIFRIRLIDIEYDKPEPPKIPINCEIEIPSNLLKDAVADVALYSDKLEFNIDDDYFILKSEDDFGEVEVKYLHGANIPEKAKSRYALDKIQSMLKSSKFSPTINIGLGNDKPLLLDFILPTGYGKLGFMLAPMLEEED